MSRLAAWSAPFSNGAAALVSVAKPLQPEGPLPGAALQNLAFHETGQLPAVPLRMERQACSSAIRRVAE